jgi:hypothetical protein
MSHNLTESPAFTANVPVPDGGDGGLALGLENMAQALANRGTYLQKLVELAGGLGVKRIAFTTGAMPATPNDGDVCYVVASGIYRYNVAGSGTPDGVMIVDGPGSVGRWFHETRGVRGLADGLASLDTGGKVPDVQIGRASANGVASLDSGGKVPDAQLGRASANGVASLDASKTVIGTAATSSAAPGVHGTGDGAGAGVAGTGGATGAGGSFTGGSGGGAGVTALGQGGGSGVEGTGSTTSAGGSFTGGPTSGNGGTFNGGGTNGIGMQSFGAGTGSGVEGFGGASGLGGKFTGSGARGAINLVPVGALPTGAAGDLCAKTDGTLWFFPGTGGGTAGWHQITLA